MASSTLVWISGASSGIGRALATAVPHDDATVFDLSRSGGTAGTTHVAVDLADPTSWPVVADHMAQQMAEHSPDRVIFINSAGTLEPMGPAGTVDQAAYTSGVLLNSAAPQVLGNAFVAAVRAAGVADATAVFLGSGAATKPYEGWSSYCGAKAGQDHWVRTVGLEQARSTNPIRVIVIAPGVVGTAMQDHIRQQSEADFPARDKFIDLFERGELTAPEDAAAGIWSVVGRSDIVSGAVLDLRSLSS